MYPAAEHGNEKLRNQILANSHEIYVYSFEAMDETDAKLDKAQQQALVDIYEHQETIWWTARKEL